MAKYNGKYYTYETKPIDEIINQVRQYGTKSWIWDGDKIRDDVYVCDIFPILEDLKEFEIELSDEEFANIIENGKADNTYNWGANISNDLDFIYIDGINGGCVIMVHLSGDVRDNYSDYFAIEDIQDLFDLESTYQTKDIDDRYSADMNAFADAFDVYDQDTFEIIGECYDIERKDVLEWIKQNTSDDLEESKSTKTASKTLKESVRDDDIIWRSDATVDFIWYGNIDEVIDFYPDMFTEEELEELSDDEIRDRVYDNYIEIANDYDYEDLMENVVPMISKQCFNDYIWFIGTYKTWQKSNDAIGFYTDAEDGIEKVCYPGYDNTSVLYTDDKGEIVWTEYSHDAPMGGSDMKLYSFKDKAAYDRAVEIADEMYEEEEGSTFKDDYGYYQDVDDVAEWSDWLNRVIDEGLLTGISVEW